MFRVPWGPESCPASFVSPSHKPVGCTLGNLLSHPFPLIVPWGPESWQCRFNGIGGWQQGETRRQSDFPCSRQLRPGQGVPGSPPSTGLRPQSRGFPWAAAGWRMGPQEERSGRVQGLGRDRVDKEREGVPSSHCPSSPPCPSH